MPGYRYSFPRDHGAHPQFATEWWYYTGNLRSADGRRFGYQATWFRTALSPQVKRASGFATRDLYFAHLAISDESGGQFYFTDRLERGALGLAGADVLPQQGSGSQPVKVWLGQWRLGFRGSGGNTQELRARGTSDAGGTRGKKFGLELSQHSALPPVINGQQGVSQKSAGRGRASHYYSYTRLKTSGILHLNGERLAVQGESWFDHEFGSNQLGADQVGWDWFSLHLEDGRDLMVYRIRLRNGGSEPYSSGTLVQRDGTYRHLRLQEFSLQAGRPWKSPQSGASYPITWRVLVPSERLDLKVEATFPAQELLPRRSGAGAMAYWEGSVRVSGVGPSEGLAGRGYLEMTGYAKAFGNLF